MYSRPVEQDVHRRHRFREHVVVDRKRRLVLDVRYRVGEFLFYQIRFDREPLRFDLQIPRLTDPGERDIEEEPFAGTRGDDVDCLSHTPYRHDSVCPLQQGIEFDRHERFS